MTELTLFLFPIEFGWEIKKGTIKSTKKGDRKGRPYNCHVIGCVPASARVA
jgi:hypothetical protein